ncbi:MAG: flavodoxin-dependent (E)-4-hydroxy-3-methylbut-2-enyl-diphosphate synthase [Candidatus Omnitrophota bacterium]
MERRKTKTVKIGPVKVGGNSLISVQSMTKTATEDVTGTVRQIHRLEKLGCEIIRVAVRDTASACAVRKIKAKINIPLVADIHFNYRLGLQAIDCGADGLRLNPGNIYRHEEIKAVIASAKKRKIPIRVGVNSGSLTAIRKSASSGKSVPREARTADLSGRMARFALDYIKILEEMDFYDIVVSLKASDVAETVQAYKKLAAVCSYPLHLGITAAGLPQYGMIKSAVGIGSLLLEGIGDTIRVSLTGDPEEEVTAARNILQSLGIRNFTPEIIACPTCGRTQANIVGIVEELTKKLGHREFAVNRPLKIAVMGCEVNGPGEAKEADLGIAAGKGCGLLFRKGKVVEKIKEENFVRRLLLEIEKSGYITGRPAR